MSFAKATEITQILLSRLPEEGVAEDVNNEIPTVLSKSAKPNSDVHCINTEGNCYGLLDYENESESVQPAFFSSQGSNDILAIRNNICYENPFIEAFDVARNEIATVVSAIKDCSEKLCILDQMSQADIKYWIAEISISQSALDIADEKLAMLKDEDIPENSREEYLSVVYDMEQIQHDFIEISLKFRRFSIERHEKNAIAPSHKEILAEQEIQLEPVYYEMSPPKEISYINDLSAIQERLNELTTLVQGTI
jgi:hypothetical protein